MIFSAITLTGYRVEFSAASWSEAIEYAEGKSMADLGKVKTVHYL